MAKSNLLQTKLKNTRGKQLLKEKLGKHSDTRLGVASPTWTCIETLHNIAHYVQPTLEALQADDGYVSDVWKIWSTVRELTSTVTRIGRKNI